MPLLPWDYLSFTSKFKVTCGAIGCTTWLTESLHQIGVSIYVLRLKEIDTDLAAKPSSELLGPFTANGACANDVRVLKTILLLSPYMGMSPKNDLTPAEAGRRL